MEEENEQIQTNCLNKNKCMQPKLTARFYSGIIIKCLAKRDYTSLKHNKIFLGAVFIILLSVAIRSFFNHVHSHSDLTETSIKVKRYFVHTRINADPGFLHNVFNILQRLGYINSSNNSDWDLLWAHDYPFREFQLYKLGANQKVNKIPGSGYITNKVDLATSDLKYIPKAFRLPKDKEKLLEYAQYHPDAKFVQKHNQHRHIYIRDVNSIDLDINGTFVQEYVEKPLLVSGYKFDIGIYTVITSIDPLRVYIYNGDALLRFCSHKYYPFDQNDIDKYVVGDDYLPTWKVPSLANYYNNLGFGMKESLNAYLRMSGKNPQRIWEQIEDAIKIVCLSKEPKIAASMKRYSKRNFFEMMRFDFVVDEDLNVFLMEANMSPNLSSAHFPPNRLLFEQVIYNLLGLVGVGERVRRNTWTVKSEWETKMQVDDKNIVVSAEECSSLLCQDGCTSPSCQICKHCLTSEVKNILMDSYLEHQYKGDFRRVFPPKMDPSHSLRNLGEYSLKNQLLCKWFHGKCTMDNAWCT